MNELSPFDRATRITIGNSEFANHSVVGAVPFFSEGLIVLFSFIANWLDQVDV